VDDSEQTTRAAPVYAVLTDGCVEIKYWNVPPGEAAHFISAAQIGCAAFAG
jgi:hypothetical protein